MSYTVQAEQKAEQKPPTIEHTSPILNTAEKLSSVLNNRTLRDITHLLEPYERIHLTPSSLLKLLILILQIIHCYDRTHKLLQSLDSDSPRITQSSQAIQSTFESMTTLFNSTNLH